MTSEFDPVVDFKRPEAAFLRPWMRALEPWRVLANPRFDGWENLPAERPLLFVGHHTLWGVLDVPLLWRELLFKKDIILRGLGDHAHFKVPYMREVLWRFGAVDGTRSNAHRLLERGACVLVFPGGAREVTRRKGEKYTLHWQGRTGWARLAIQHGCTIVPWATVGGDDVFDIVMDKDDIKRTRIGRALAWAGWRKDLFFPVIKGIGRTPLPKPARIYFRFLDPVRTHGYKGRVTDEAVDEVWAETKARIEAGIAQLLIERRTDPKRWRFLPTTFDDGLRDA